MCVRRMTTRGRAGREGRKEGKRGGVRTLSSCSTLARLLYSATRVPAVEPWGREEGREGGREGGREEGSEGGREG